jgi:hypothetical protein
MNVEDVINYFYTKKKRYDAKINKKKADIRDDPELSLEEKREAYKNIKMNCIKCKRPVGTIFSTNNRQLIAKCGDESQPCSLDIRVNLGTYENIPILLEGLKHDINLAKTNISKIKLDLLFNLIDEDKMEESFNQMKGLYKQLVEAKGTVDEQIQKFNLMRVEEVGEERIIERRIVAEGQQLKLNNYIQNFRNLVKEEEGETADMRIAKMDEAIDIYMNLILPANKIIRDALNDIVVVLYEKGKYKLVKIPRSLEKQQLEIEAPKIISNKK